MKLAQEYRHWTRDELAQRMSQPVSYRPQLPPYCENFGTKAHVGPDYFAFGLYVDKQGRGHDLCATCASAEKVTT